MSADKARSWSAQAFVVLCVLLGGASAPGSGVMANAILQFIALCLILFSVWTRASAPYPTTSRPLVAIVGLWLLFVLLYFIPLPHGLWSSLPGREPIARGFELLGVGQPSLPTTLAPERSIVALLGFLPPIAMFLLAVQLSESQRRRLVITIIAAAALAACLGAAQIATGRQSPLRPYTVTNPDMAVGFFANGNHQATLLLCALALVGFLMARAAGKGSGRGTSAAIAAPGMIGLFLLVAIAIVGSLAGYGLLLPVSAGALLLYRRAVAGKVGWKWGSAVAVLFVAAAGIAFVGPFESQDTTNQLGGDRTSRRVMAATTIEAAQQHLPLGSGLGTFSDIYRTFEDPLVPAFSYVNHAHNDYLEVLLEKGLPGILLILCFLAWYGWTAWSAWRSSQEGSNLQRAATLVILVVLVHSTVDYPIRTAAIGAIFAAACAMMLPARVRRSRSPRVEEAKQARHLEAE